MKSYNCCYSKIVGWVELSAVLSLEGTWYVLLHVLRTLYTRLILEYVNGSLMLGPTSKNDWHICAYALLNTAKTIGSNLFFLDYPTGTMNG